MQSSGIFPRSGIGERALWTVSLAIVAFQLVVLAGFVMAGASLALRPSASR